MSDRKTTHFRNSVGTQRNRHAFTLVELMVSIVLVVILLLMYATVFEQASSAITTQKAIGKNDERSRMLSIVIKDDLNRRTFWTVTPFDPSKPNSDPPPDWPNLKGYFSISENDPTDHTDDVLSFTMKHGESLYFGKATFLTESSFSDSPTPNNYVDQLEGDDGLLPLGIDTDNDGILDQDVLKNFNQLGASSAAEVVYFLRNGTLYRRIQLIREPYASSILDPPMITGDFSDLNNIHADFQEGGSFWNYFDYSVHYDRFVTPSEVRFHGTSYLDNTEPAPFKFVIKPNIAPVPPDELPFTLGNPYLRIGNGLSKMDENTTDGSNSDPQPTEFITDPDPDGDPATNDSITEFIGRYTMQETSHSGFGYPGLIPTAGDPHARTFTGSLLTDGVVTAYSGETLRRGEDILLTNVHSFDIKVWDDGLATPGFVDLGHGGGGNYGGPSNLFDPLKPNFVQKFGNRYDTWTPFSSPHIGLPTYRPFLGAVSPANGSPDVLRLKAIQITIRFLDEASGKMRQLTIQHALNTNPNN